MENTSFQHVLIQSRTTILDLLEKRGYNTTPFRKIIGPELTKFVNTPEALRMSLISKTDPEKKAIVEYIFTSIKQSVGTGDYIKRMLEDTSKEGEEAQETSPTKKASSGADSRLSNVNPATTEVIVLYLGREISDDKDSPYDKCALEAWTKYQFKIQFFPLMRLVFNPLEHFLQPKFEIVPPEQHEQLKKEWYITSKTQLPIIKFHVDMAARCLGLMPLDIVKITTYSPTSGEYIKYRVCSP
jgi:DNA-directed RNA polymerase subunit H (RpoH/RPB5)